MSRYHNSAENRVKSDMLSSAQSDARNQHFTPKGSASLWRKGILAARIRKIRASGLFDCGWYSDLHGLEGGENFIISHYLNNAGKIGNSPHPLFDTNWYRRATKGRRRSNITDLEHYIKYGRRLGLDPTPIFDRAWYRSQVLGPMSKGDEFRHFLHSGALAGLSPHPLFDVQHYLSQDKGLVAKSINPLTHYVACGAAAGNSPNPMFDGTWYSRTYADQLPQGANPLAHFIVDGAAMGFAPHPAINLDHLCSQNEVSSQTRIDCYTELVRGIGEVADREAFLEKLRVAEAQVRARKYRVRPTEILPELDLSRPAWNQSDLVPPMPSRDNLADMPRPALSTELITVDVWDTLIRRDCYPDEIKLQSARYLYLTAYHDIRPMYRDIKTLLKARTNCENASADNDEFEYRLTDAIDRLLLLVLREGLPEVTIDTYRTGMMAHEFASELCATRPDAAMASHLRDIKTPAVFLSDFYTSSEFLNKLLDAHGVSGSLIKGYASSDTFETKRSGALYDKVIAESGIDPSGILHIGDHEHADVNMARAKGLLAHHYVDADEVRRRNWFGEGFYAWREGDVAIHHRRIQALCEKRAGTFIGDEGEAIELRRLGARIAPLAVGFVLSIIEHATREKMPKVHYFTREGLFFSQVHEAIVEADPFGIGCPAAEILHVSRRATFAASLDGVTVKELMNIWRLYSTQSLIGLAATLNLDVSAVCSLAESVGISPEEPVSEPWRDKALTKFLSSSKFQELAKPALAEQKKNLLAYIASKNIFQENRLMIVDIGWRGTIQDNLAKLLPEINLEGHYLGLFSYLNPQAPNIEKTGWIFDDARGIPSQIGDVAPLEMIFNGPCGSVTGYTVGEGGVTPITEIVEGEESVIRGPVAAIQSGIIAAIPELVRYIRLHGLTSADLRDLASHLCTSLSKSPPPVLAGVFQRLQHNEMFGLGVIDDVAKSSALATVLENFTGSDLHAAASREVKRARWAEGVVRDPKIGEWWARATWQQRSCLPLAISKAHAPAVIRARGSKMVVYMPSPIRASGGHRTILNMVRRLEKIGLQAEIFVENVGAGLSVVEEYLQETPAIIHSGWYELRPSEIAFATVAHSAKFVAGLKSANHRGYLVQDFEAIFNPMSDNFIAGENSFALGLQHFTIGNWLTHVIANQYGGASVAAGLGVDTEIYRRLEVSATPLSRSKPNAEASDLVIDPLAKGAQITRRKKEDAVCFLYQPDKPRRLPQLGIDALRRVKRERPDCKIYVYGSDLDLDLDFEVENLGLVNSLDELNKLYNRCTAGLCISGSNPSRIPYEMMAAGCVPVDLYRYNNLLDHKANTILLCYQNSESLAKAILSLLNDSDLGRRMSEEGSRFVSTRTLDWEMDVIGNSVLALLEGKLPRSVRPELLYDVDPIIVAKGSIEYAERFCAGQMAMARSG